MKNNKEISIASLEVRLARLTAETKSLMEQTRALAVRKKESAVARKATSTSRRLKDVDTSSPEFAKAEFLTKRQLLRREKFSSAEYTHRLVSNGRKFNANITRKMAQNHRAGMVRKGLLKTLGTPNPYNTAQEIYTFRS